MVFDSGQSYFGQSRWHIWNVPIFNPLGPVWELLFHHIKVLGAIQGDSEISRF